MKTATILRYVSHSAWPIVVVLALVIYHRPVSRIIERSNIHVTAAGVDVTLTPREAEKILAESPVVKQTTPDDVKALEKLDTPLPMVSHRQIKRLKRAGLVEKVDAPAPIPESGSIAVTETSSNPSTGTIATNASVELTTWGEAVQRAAVKE